MRSARSRNTCPRRLPCATAKEKELRHLLRPLLEGLATVHAEDVLHRDIKPGNVFVRRRDEQPVLLDFGAAKEDFSKHSKSQAPHTPGYAAPEQVEDEGHLGPWTDVYAVGALMWRVATGTVPPSAESRSFALVRGPADPLVIDEGTGGGRSRLRRCWRCWRGRRQGLCRRIRRRSRTTQIQRNPG